MTDKFERMTREVEGEMDLGAIWEVEYKTVLAKEIANKVREQARKEAQEDIRKRLAEGKGISR